MRVIAEVTFSPLGTPTASVSPFVAAALAALRNYPQVQYQLGAMSTVLEGERADVIAAVEAMNEAVFAAGAPRVGTTLKIDERRDKESSAAHKVAVVQALIGAGEEAEPGHVSDDPVVHD